MPPRQQREVLRLRRPLDTRRRLGHERLVVEPLRDDPRVIETRAELVVSGPQSGDLATALLSLLEGAFILGRATRSTEPVLASGRAAVALVRAALER